MGYFEGLTSSYFKTAADGRKLFYPWGVLGRGYVVPTQQDQQRLLRQLKIYVILSLVLIVGACALGTYMAALLIAVVLIVFYLFWARHLIRGLQPSDERMSLRESYTSQALGHSIGSLWFMEISSLLLLVSGVAIFIFDPDSKLMALAVIVLFGFTTALVSWMLVVRRRAQHPPLR